MAQPYVQFLHPRATPDHVGFIPSFLDTDDPRPAREQIHDNYRHGGGWNAFKGHTMDPNFQALRYPGDPARHALALMKIRDERVFIYENAWVAIVQPTGEYEVARID